MKKYTLLLVLLITMAGMTSCKFGCDLEKKSAEILTANIATALQCSGFTAINADITALLDKTGICTQAGGKMGPIANIICPALSTLVVSQLANQIPATWECTAQNAQTNLAKLLEDYCKKLPF